MTEIYVVITAAERHVVILLFQGALTLLMLGVIVYDASRFKIPNWLVELVILLWPLMLVAAHGKVDWQDGLIVFGITFLLGVTLFSLKLLGGGDVKLLAACMLWVGAGTQQAILDFIIYTALLGGALALLLIVGRPYCEYIIPESKMPRLLKKSEKFMPYGLAIAAAFLILLWGGEIPGVR
jgi:prepilin peptidase CpaA